LTAYKFNEAADTIYQFVWRTFCDWYLEFTKPVLQAGGDEAQEVRKTSAWVIQQILTLLNPFMPYITEELNAQLLGINDSLISQEWPKYDPKIVRPEAEKEMAWLIKVISEIRSVRSDMNVPAAAKIKLLIKDANPITGNRLKKYDEIIKRMARLDSIAMAYDVPKGSIQIVLEEAMLILPIANIIDLDAERARLKKQIEKLEDDINKTLSKLENKQFVDNAPEEIVIEYRARIAEATQTKLKLSTALTQLEAA
jgi:valyl-tRNA synthetase